MEHPTQLSPLHKISITLSILLIGVWVIWKTTKKNPTSSQISQAIPEYYTLTPFSLQTNNNTSFSLENIKTAIWIAHTLYNSTHFKNKALMKRIISLHQSISKYPKIFILSVLINPESLKTNNTSLQSFAKRYSKHSNRWLFLTGSHKDIQHFVVDNLKLMLPHTNQHSHHTHELFHSEKLILIDHKGFVRGYYNAFDISELQQLIQRAKILLKNLPKK